MHDTQHPPTDDAARAIRDALPAPDAATTERIAQLIADCAPTARPAVVAPPAWRRSPRRRLGILRPVLAVGAVAVAGAVALLAPGNDPTSPDRGLLALGPDVAAAEALAVAGDTAARADWHPLRAGEYHYTRTEFSGDQQRMTVVHEQWFTADGTGHVRYSHVPQFVPAGERFFVPASECQTTLPGSPLPDISRTLAVGSAIPECWKQHGLNPMLGGAVGPIIDAPPAGAFVELPHGPGSSDVPMRFGSEVLEGTKFQPVPPGPMPTTGTPEDPIEGGFTPFQMAPGTTWVEVVSQPVLMGEFSITVDQAKRRVVPGLSTWSSVYGLDELGDLPTTADAMLRELRQMAKAKQVSNVPQVPDGVSFAAQSNPNARIPLDAATLTLALDLLANAPISPQVRRAIFTALAELRLNGKPATVVEGATFADGRPAFAIDFSAEPTVGFEYPGSADDVSRMLFDPETAAFRGVETEYGTSRVVVSHNEPERVASIPPFEAD